MKLFVLFAQRKERYPGEYAPEALHCIDEYGNDDNPSFLLDAKADAIATGEFSTVEIIALDFNGAKVHSILNPTHEVIPASIGGEQP